MTNSTWKSIPPTQACDWIEFWMNAPWPMDEKQTAEYAAQLGWTAEEDEGEIYLTNVVSGLSIPEVMLVTMPSGEAASIDFHTTDAIRDITNESTEFLNDYYTLVYREAEARWGAGKQTTSADGSSAMWDLEDKGRVTLNKGARAVSINFDTPHYTAVLRDLGE